MDGSTASGRVSSGRVTPAPTHVAILGLGPSLSAYLDIVKTMGGRSAYCDEVWAINALGDCVACDRIFHMDDVRVQETRAAALPDSNIAHMLRWLRRHPGPIYTSRVHADFPGLVAYPLEAVINDLGQAYFNSTAAYAVAYAIHLGVRKISIHGMDFTYPDAHDAEKGRACVEFWLGIAHARGIKISVGRGTTLLDAFVAFPDRFYGYDTHRVKLTGGEPGAYRVEFVEVEAPSAEEIEARYDHGRHPNAIVEAGT